MTAADRADYLKTVTFAGRADAVLKTAQAAFINQNFEIVESSPQILRVHGRRKLNSTDENPLRGVSEAAFIARGATIEITARFDAARSLSRFAKYFPILLGFGLFFVFGATFGAIAYFQPSFREPWIFLSTFGIIVVSLLPSLVLSPWTARRIEKNTRDALDTLVKNMLVVNRRQ